MMYKSKGVGIRRGSRCASVWQKSLADEGKDEGETERLKKKEVGPRST